MKNLCLTRRHKEKVLVVIDGKPSAWVTLLTTSKSDAMLGFEAEPKVKFYRLEVWERMQKEGAK